MTSMTFFLVFVPILSLILLMVSFFLAPHKPDKNKNSQFECGFSSFTQMSRHPFNISFFIFGLLFLLFDLEILLLYPFAVSYSNNSGYGLFTLMLFFILLTIGFVFELGKKALSLDSKQNRVISNMKNHNVNKSKGSLLSKVIVFIKTSFNKMKVRLRSYLPQGSSSNSTDSYLLMILIYTYAIFTYLSINIDIPRCDSESDSDFESLEYVIEDSKRKSDDLELDKDDDRDSKRPKTDEEWEKYVASLPAPTEEDRKLEGAPGSSKSSSKGKESIAKPSDKEEAKLGLSEKALGKRKVDYDDLDAKADESLQEEDLSSEDYETDDTDPELDAQIKKDQYKKASSWGMTPEEYGKAIRAAHRPLEVVLQDIQDHIAANPTNLSEAEEAERQHKLDGLLKEMEERESNENK